MGYDEEKIEYLEDVRYSINKAYRMIEYHRDRVVRWNSKKHRFALRIWEEKLEIFEAIENEIRKH